jgi:hypothetical protein
MSWCISYLLIEFQIPVNKDHTEKAIFYSRINSTIVEPAGVTYILPDHAL